MYVRKEEDFLQPTFEFFTTFLQLNAVKIKNIKNLRKKMRCKAVVKCFPQEDCGKL